MSPFSYVQAQRTNDALLSGSTVSYYERGSTTPVGIYADPDATSLIGSSVTADSEGYFPIHFIAGLDLKAVLSIGGMTRTYDGFGDSATAADRLAFAQALGLRKIVSGPVGLFVNADSGNDTTGDGSASKPWGTLQKAVIYLRDYLDIQSASVSIYATPAATPYAGVNLYTYVGNVDVNPGTPNSGAPGDTFSVPRIVIQAGAHLQGPAGLGAVNAVACFAPWCIVNDGLIDNIGFGNGILADFSSMLYVAGNGIFGACNQGVFYAEWLSQIEILAGSTFGFLAGSDMLARVVRGGQVLGQISGGHVPALRMLQANGTLATDYLDCPNFTSGVAYAVQGIVDLSAVTWSGTNNGVHAVQQDGGIVISPQLLPGRALSSNPDSIDRRTRLNSPQAYYVDVTNGFDGGNGVAASYTANTQNGPWATITHALNWIAQNIDLGGFDVTVNVAAGDYSANPIQPSIPFVGAGRVIISGASSVLACTGVGAPVSLANGAKITLRGFTISSTDNDLCDVVGIGSELTIDASSTFGATPGICFNASLGGQINLASNYAISASQMYHLYAQRHGRIYITGGTATLSGTPAFTDFALATDLGLIERTNGGYSGSATGKYYSAILNSVINTAGGGGAFFPGNTSGTTATGGQYA